MRYVFLILSLTGCVGTWDYPPIRPKHKPNNCVKIVNGKYIYDDLCGVPHSDSQAILPP